MFRHFVDYLFGAPRRLSDVDRYVIATMSDIGASAEEIARTFGYDGAVVAAAIPQTSQARGSDSLQYGPRLNARTPCPAKETAFFERPCQFPIVLSRHGNFDALRQMRHDRQLNATQAVVCAADLR